MLPKDKRCSKTLHISSIIVKLYKHCLQKLQTLPIYVVMAATMTWHNRPQIIDNLMNTLEVDWINLRLLRLSPILN